MEAISDTVANGRRDATWPPLREETGMTVEAHLTGGPAMNLARRLVNGRYRLPPEAWLRVYEKHDLPLANGGDLHSVDDFER